MGIFSIFDQCRELWIYSPLSDHNMPHYSSISLIELRRCGSSSSYITLNYFIIHTHTHILCTLKDIIKGLRPEIHQYNILKFKYCLTENTLFLEYVDKKDNKSNKGMASIKKDNVR